MWRVFCGREDNEFCWENPQRLSNSERDSKLTGVGHEQVSEKSFQSETKIKWEQIQIYE